jgi:hypothetical protein
MIYESPDGGQTVYERHPGKTGRKLIKYKELPKWYIDIREFNNIMHHASESPALQETLMQLKIIWELTKES